MLRHPFNLTLPSLSVKESRLFEFIRTALGRGSLPSQSDRANKAFSTAFPLRTFFVHLVATLAPIQRICLD